MTEHRKYKRIKENRGRSQILRSTTLSISRLYGKGLSVKSISKKLGISTTTIYTYIKSLGVKKESLLSPQQLVLRKCVASLLCIKMPPAALKKILKLKQTKKVIRAWENQYGYSEDYFNKGLTLIKYKVLQNPPKKKGSKRVKER